MLTCRITQDQHTRAFEWLEEQLEDKIYLFDMDDLVAMIEQVVMQ